jgi:hypothetical protein
MRSRTMSAITSTPFAKRPTDSEFVRIATISSWELISMRSGLASSGTGINDLLNDAMKHGAKIKVSDDSFYYLWQPGGGPELWVGVREAGGTKDLLAMTPYFRGPSRLTVRIEALDGDPEYPFEGRASVWAVRRDDEDEEFPFQIDSGSPGRSPQLQDVQTWVATLNHERPSDSRTPARSAT